MKIESIKAEKIFIPLKGSFDYALASMSELPYVLVMVKSESYTGVGEAACAIDVTGEDQESVLDTIEKISSLVIGKEITSMEDIKEIFDNINFKISANQAAKSGLEMALFDVLGKEKGLPVYKILGGEDKGFVKSQKTFGFLKEENLEQEVIDSLNLAKDLGSEIIKYKVGLSDNYDLSLIELIRKHNQNVRIVIDVNQGWKTLEKAREMFSKLEKYNLDWIEQPLLADDYDGSAVLKKEFKTPVMIDEGLKSVEDCKLIKEKEAADLINIKISKVGGFLSAKKIIDFCEQNDIKYMLGDMIHSNIGLAANLHLSTLGNFVSYDIDNSRVKDVLAFGIKKKDLIYEIPQSPGLGIELVR